MKKQILPLVLVAVAIVAGCKREESVLEKGVDYSGPIMVGFNNYGGVAGSTSYTKSELAIKDSLQDVIVEVKLSNTTGTAPSDISVYLTKVDALVTNYNTANSGSLTPVINLNPGLQYDFSKPLVIKQGERKASVTIKVNPTKLDLSKSNAIGIGILRVEGADATVSTAASQAKLVLEFGARNRYDGYYETKGEAYHPSYGTYTWNSQGIYACGDGFALVTSGENSVDLAPGQPLFTAGTLTFFSAVLPRFAVNASTNKVAISSTNSTVFVQYPAYDSRYDPATKSFYIKYGWNGDRIATDTLIYCGPR